MNNKQDSGNNNNACISAGISVDDYGKNQYLHSRYMESPVLSIREKSSTYCGIPRVKTCLLIAVAVFVVLVPWFEGLSFYADKIMADGVMTGAITALIIAIGFSLVSWPALLAASKDVKLSGIVLGTITGAAVIVPFVQILGPMAGVIVGVVAGLAAFLLQNKMMHPAMEDKSLTYAVTTLTAAYLVLIAVAVLASPTSSMWDTGDGIGAWPDTADELEIPRTADKLPSVIGVSFFLAAISSLTATALIVGSKR